VLITLSLFIGTSTAFLVKYISALNIKYCDGANSNFDSLIFKRLYPLITIILPYVSRLKLQYLRKKVKQLIMESRLEENVSIDEIISFQLVLLFILFFLSSSFFFGLVGFVYPILLLWLIKRNRFQVITYEMPYVLDMIVLTMRAGLDFYSALDRIVKNRSESVVRKELLFLLGHIRFGKTKKDALKDLKKRLYHPSVCSIVNFLIQADGLGVPISKILNAYAEKLRQERFYRAEKLGVLASQKILVPLIFCIMPCVFIVVFGPIYIMLRQGYFERILM